MKLPIIETLISIEWMRKTVCLGYAKRNYMLNCETGEQDETLQKLQLTNIMSEEYNHYTCFVRQIGQNPSQVCQITYLSRKSYPNRIRKYNGPMALLWQLVFVFLM